MSFGPKEQLQEIVCSKLQNKCFDIVDLNISEFTFTRRLQSETILGAFASQLVFKRLGTYVGIDKEKYKTPYTKCMLQAGFLLQSFDNIWDFQRAKILQIGLGGGALNTILAENFPDVRFMEFYT